MRLLWRPAAAAAVLLLLATLVQADLADLHDRLEAVMKKQRQIEDVVSRSRAVGRGISFYDVARTVAGEWSGSSYLSIMYVLSTEYYKPCVQ